MKKITTMSLAQKSKQNKAQDLKSQRSIYNICDCSGKSRQRSFAKIFASRRGEGYIDVVVLVLCAVLVIAFAVNLFPVYMTKQKVDTFATELVREAEIAGRVGGETSAEEMRLRDDLGISPSVSWSTSGAVQLNGEISVTVTITEDIGLFGEFASFPVTLTGKASGKSEVYHK